MNTEIILPTKDSWSRKEVIALMAATANHVRTNGYGGCSISNHLASVLFEKWENNNDKFGVEDAPKDSWTREEMRVVAEKAFFEGVGITQREIYEGASITFDNWFDKNY